ncbi:MAG: hypothetical protein ACP5N1_02510 [Candidatus Woesearchaeota archaeon]
MTEKNEDKLENKSINLSDKSLDLLLHGLDNNVSINKSDIFCEYAKWMGEDLNHCPGIGEWKCNLQKYYYASDQYGYDSMDYKACNNNDHTQCKIYLNTIK